MHTLLLSMVFLFIVQNGLAGKPAVRTGIDVLCEQQFDILRGKRVGLITNPTGVNAQLKSTIDILSQAKEVTLVALFGPEHGARGDFAGGDTIDTYTDPKTGLPVYSLYGRTRKPTPDMLKGLDALVYDIQDIGCRSYTYISTMGVAMEAAAEQGIEFVVLDRPNPLGGDRVEGNLVETNYESFVSRFPIPYVYGLTCGELARFLNEEGLLHGGARCKLIVVPMSGWRRTMTFQDTGLLWVPASPHIPAYDSPEYYVSTGVVGELGIISEGVGYTIPFRILAAEWIDPGLLADELNGLKLEGIFFRPITFTPFYGKHTGKKLGGVQLHITDESRLNLLSLQFLFLQANNKLYPDRNPFAMADSSRLAMFDKVAGTDRIRKEFRRRMSYDDIKELLEKDVEAFRIRSSKYYLYH